MFIGSRDDDVHDFGDASQVTVTILHTYINKKLNMRICNVQRSQAQLEPEAQAVARWLSGKVLD